MKVRLMSLAMLVALLGAFVAAPLAVRAQAGPGIAPVPVHASKNGGTKTFDGAFTVTRFVGQGGRIFAEGVLAGDVANKHGKVTHSVEETVLVPVSVPEEAVATAVQGNAKAMPQLQTCQIL